MKATWSMQSGLEVRGHHHGEPRIWTVKDWAVAGGQKLTVLVRPKGKVRLAQLIDLTNDALMELERETGLPAVDAGFMAMAR